MTEYPGGYMKMANAIKKYENVSYFNVFGSTQKWIKDELPNNSSILDYGCGNGSLGATGKMVIGDLFNNKVLHIVGFDDFDKTNTEARYHDQSEVKWSYDYIIASNLLEHYQPGDVRDLLKWYSEHCTKGLYIIIPNTANPFLNFWCDSTHVRPYDIPELYYWLEMAGFKIVKVVRSGLPRLRWYSLVSRLITSKLLFYSPFNDFVVVCEVS